MADEIHLDDGEEEAMGRAWAALDAERAAADPLPSARRPKGKKPPPARPEGPAGGSPPASS